MPFLAENENDIILIPYELCHEKNCLLGFLLGQTQTGLYSDKMVSGLKCRIKEVEGLYYLCSKGADQLCN